MLWLQLDTASSFVPPSKTCWLTMRLSMAIRAKHHSLLRAKEDRGRTRQWVCLLSWFRYTLRHSNMIRSISKPISTWLAYIFREKNMISHWKIIRIVWAKIISWGQRSFHQIVFQGIFLHRAHLRSHSKYIELTQKLWYILQQVHWAHTWKFTRQVLFSIWTVRSSKPANFPQGLYKFGKLYWKQRTALG